ncbi:MAG: allantoinase [Acidobacteria bacterium]|nr:allantoinase [Acidobacteriota bacterium]
MAKLALVYGMRLFPADELAEVKEATVILRNGQAARVTLHLLEGSLAEIRRQFDESVSAFFEFFPEI